MSSSSYFASGLNNWAGSDKPARLDFVNDNRILDEGAMWKAAYDADGTVAAAGGFAEYALPKNTYDGEGIVATSGGIVPFVQLEARGFTRNYNRATALVNPDTGALEITSLEEHAEPFYDLQFIAPERYDINRPMIINGELMDGVFTLEGNPLPDSAWAQGAPVCLTKKESSAFFKQGGGAGANYDVMGATTRPASRENRLWINTGVPVGKYGLCASIPDASTVSFWGEFSEGDVLVYIAAKGGPIFVPFEGNKGMQAAARGTYQYISGEWVALPGEIYLQGEWKPLWDGVLFSDGSIKVPMQLVSQGAPVLMGHQAMSVVDVRLRHTGSGGVSQYICGGVLTTEKIDLTAWDYVEVKFHGSEDNALTHGVRSLAIFDTTSIEVAGYQPSNAIATRPLNGAGTEAAPQRLDVRNINRPVYIGLITGGISSSSLGSQYTSYYWDLRMS